VALLLHLAEILYLVLLHQMVGAEAELQVAPVETGVLVEALIRDKMVA
jgi:hypothetical protein